MACRTEFSIGQRVVVVRAENGMDATSHGNAGTLNSVTFDKKGVRFFVTLDSGGLVVADKIKVAKAEAKPAPAQPAPAASETKT